MDPKFEARIIDPQFKPVSSMYTNMYYHPRDKALLEHGEQANR